MKKKDIYKMIREGRNWEAAEALTEFHSEEKLGGAQGAVDLFMKYAFKRQEYYFIASLNSAHGVIAVHEITKGILNSVPVHPREIFRSAILDNAAGIVIGHNHPSGSLELSEEDIVIINDLSKAGEVLGIPVLDHILISRNGASSYMSEKEEECDSDSQGD